MLALYSDFAACWYSTKGVPSDTLVTASVLLVDVFDLQFGDVVLVRLFEICRVSHHPAVLPPEDHGNGASPDVTVKDERFPHGRRGIR